MSSLRLHGIPLLKNNRIGRETPGERTYTTKGRHVASSGKSSPTSTRVRLQPHRLINHLHSAQANVHLPPLDTD